MMCHKIKDRSPPPATRGSVVKRETKKCGHTRRQPAKRPTQDCVDHNATQNNTYIKNIVTKPLKQEKFL